MSTAGQKCLGRLNSEEGILSLPKNSHSPALAVVGLGYVGLPLALEFARRGCTVIGLDIAPAKTGLLREGRCYLKHVPAEDLPALIQSNLLQPTTDFGKLSVAEAVIICVPTPVTEAWEPDLQFLVSTSRGIARHLTRGQLIVLESTTYPGTTEEVVLPILEESGLRCPKDTKSQQAVGDFYLAYSPERIDPGNSQFALAEIPKIVGGVNSSSTEKARRLYERVFKQVHVVSSTQTAEMTKLLENIYRAVNIALVNELKVISQRMGIDIWEVIEAAATKPFGFTPFYPGPGLGGHCIPVDPFYLAWKVRQHNMTTRFIELAGEINTAMPTYVVQAVAEALQGQGKGLKDARVLILGVAYKREVDDIRESPALKIMQLLIEQGATVCYSDPHVPQLPRTRRYDFSHLHSTQLNPATLKQCDCAVLVTDHSAFDIASIVEWSQLVIDTRNATKGIASTRGKVIRC